VAPGGGAAVNGEYRNLLIAVRYVLPAAIVIGGLVTIFVGGSSSALHGGLGIVGAGIAVWLLSFFYRIGASGERERDAEEAAREHFDRHGRWPDEDDRLPGQA
jgi:hypothetical protein